jgi:hypothetical protein
VSIRTVFTTHTVRRRDCSRTELTSETRNTMTQRAGFNRTRRHMQIVRWHGIASAVVFWWSLQSLPTNYAQEELNIFTKTACIVALISADSGFTNSLSLTEYVDALRVLSLNTSCPGTDEIPDETSPFSLPFEELSCACMAYPAGATDDLCCQGGGTNPLSVRLPIFIYPDEYLDQVCDNMQQALVEQCPEGAPSPVPTFLTVEETVTPSARPTVSPSLRPTFAPTAFPTEIPTSILEAAPTVEPSRSPTAEVVDAEAPTLAPTEAPTLAPAEAPTLAPAEAPTLAPVEAPTLAPTEDLQVPKDLGGGKDPIVETDSDDRNELLPLFATFAVLAAVSFSSALILWAVRRRQQLQDGQQNLVGDPKKTSSPDSPYMLDPTEDAEDDEGRRLASDIREVDASDKDYSPKREQYGSWTDSASEPSPFVQLESKDGSVSVVQSLSSSPREPPASGSPSRMDQLLRSLELLNADDALQVPDLEAEENEDRGSVAEASTTSSTDMIFQDNEENSVETSPHRRRRSEVEPRKKAWEEFYALAIAGRGSPKKKHPTQSPKNKQEPHESQGGSPDDEEGVCMI